MNCRIRSSERRARASDAWAANAASRAADSAYRAAVSEAARAVKAASIWVSIAFSARDSRPSSVLASSVPASGSGTRWLRSPRGDRRRGPLDFDQRLEAGPDDRRAQRGKQYQHRAADQYIDPDQPLHREVDVGEAAARRAIIRPSGSWV